jgi:hypothetical protein
MPLLTRLMLKTSLLYLALALLAGLLQASRSLLPAALRLPGLAPVYLHLFMVGWVSLLIFGVVFWMFPKFSREKPRGSEALGWGTFILINAGLILRVIGETSGLTGPGWGWVLVFSAALQLLAGLLFVLNTWPRVKER